MTARQTLEQVNQVIKGKEQAIEKILIAILAGGHVLLEDVPGIGKTTLALAFSKAMSLDFKRIQFTPDVTASDVVGFTYFDKEKNAFNYREGAAMTNFLLADEINRTTSRTQAALLEVMEEGAVTVDGQRHLVPEPFIVIATQNPIGSIGTQALPQAQLDRFMMKLSIGYPDFQSQIELLKERQGHQPLADVEAVLSASELLIMQQKVSVQFISDELLAYVTTLTMATRNHPQIVQGISPRGALAICDAAKAYAYLRNRTYVIPEDIMAVFVDVCHHRLVLQPSFGESAEDVLRTILKMTASPDLQMK